MKKNKWDITVKKGRWTLKQVDFNSYFHNQVAHWYCKDGKLVMHALAKRKNRKQLKEMLLGMDKFIEMLERNI